MDGMENHKQPPCLFTNSHVFDEYDRCFECDYQKPVSRAADMKRSRDKRKAAGLVEFRCYCTPEEKEKLAFYIASLRTRK